MKIVNAGYEILTEIDGENELKFIEKVGRVCYKSEDNITEGSANGFVKMLIYKGHEAMLEHSCLTVKFIVDRGISHEIVRHRLFSFAQESTRYCNYSKGKFGNEITVIKPCFFEQDSVEYDIWENVMLSAEHDYSELLLKGASQQEARAVLPNSLKTEVIVTGNYREWRHFFKLRTAKAAHPQMREVAIPLLEELKSRLAIIFDDIIVE